MARILICDDARYIRVFVKKVLEQAGHEVVHLAGNGEEAVQMCNELRPEVVVMDIVLPVMDGIAAARAVIADNPDTVVIMMSGFGTRQKVIKAIQSGACDFLVKPFRAERLVAAVENAMKARGEGRSTAEPAGEG